MLATPRRCSTLLQDRRCTYCKLFHTCNFKLASEFRQGGKSGHASMQPKSSTWKAAERTHAHSTQARAKHHTFLCWSHTRRKKASRYIRIKPLPSQTPRPQLRQQPATSNTPYARSTQCPLPAQLAWQPARSAVALNGPSSSVMCIPPPVLCQACSLAGISDSMCHTTASSGQEGTPPSVPARSCCQQRR